MNSSVPVLAAEAFFFKRRKTTSSLLPKRRGALGQAHKVAIGWQTRMRKRWSRHRVPIRNARFQRRAPERLNDRVSAFGNNVHMTKQYPLTLRQADEARTDFALIEDRLGFLAGQLARVPTRAYLSRVLLLATASIWASLLTLLLLQ